MRKIPLSDGSGNWFDIEAARMWEEHVDMDEQSHRDSQLPQEEKLYLTTNGTFVLYRWHGRMADGLFHLIDQERAARWLIANGYQKQLSKLELQPEEKRLEL